MSTLRSTSVYIHNRMPGGHTEEQLFDKIDIFNEKATDASPFRVEINWGGAGATDWGTEDNDTLVLNPGDSEFIEEGAARTVLRTYEDLGLFTTKTSVPDIKSTLVALNKALSHYRERGLEQITKYQQRHQLTEEQMRLERPKIVAYLYNAERAVLIEEEIKRVKAESRAPTEQNLYTVATNV